MASRREVTKRQHLCISAKQYAQRPDLSFKNPSLNSRFKLEVSEISRPNLQLLHVFAAVLGTVFGVIKLSLPLVLFSAAAYSLGNAQLKPESLLRAGSCLLVIPQLTLMNAGGLSDAVLCFALTALLHFFNSEDWKNLGKTAVAQLVVIAVATDAHWSVLSVGLGVNLAVYGMLESFLIDFWIKKDVYKKSNNLHWGLFNNSESGVLIVDLEGKVKYYNRAVFNFTSQRSSLHNSAVSAFFPKDLPIAHIMNTCTKGRSFQTLVSLTTYPQETSPQGGILAYYLTAEPTSFIGGNCIRMTLQDATQMVSQLNLAQTGLSELKNSCSLMSHELERCVKFDEVPHLSDLARLNSLFFGMSSLVSWQLYCLGSVEFSDRQFDIRSEVVDTIESAVSKYLDKLDDVVLIFDACFPTGVVGDVDHHNSMLKSLLSFAMKTISEEGAIKVYCDIVVRTRQAAGAEFKLSYKLVYPSSTVSREDLNYLTTSEQKDFDAIISVCKKHGTGFAMMPVVLSAMGGTMIDSFVQPDHKVTMAYR
jgi:hypothetical protein